MDMTSHNVGGLVMGHLGRVSGLPMATQSSRGVGQLSWHRVLPASHTPVLWAGPSAEQGLHVSGTLGSRRLGLGLHEVTVTQTLSRGKEALLVLSGTLYPWGWVSGSLLARGLGEWLGPRQGPFIVTPNPSSCPGSGGQVREGVVLRVEAGER